MLPPVGEDVFALPRGKAVKSNKKQRLTALAACDEKPQPQRKWGSRGGGDGHGDGVAPCEQKGVRWKVGAEE